MADNLDVTPGTGATMRAVEKSSKKTQVVILDLGGAGAEDLSTTKLPVKGTGFSITTTLTVTNGAYSIADVVGGLITFANACSAAGKSAIINTIILSGVVAIPYQLWFFNGDIATPAADNAAFTIVVADTLKALGNVSIAAGDYMAAQSAFNVATLRGVGLELQSAATTSIYAYLVATAVTSPGTTTLYLTISGEMID